MPFEKLLRVMVNNHYVDSFPGKFVPPNYMYKKGTFRIARKGNLVAETDIHDYNDWKAYWGLKEKEREKLYILARQARTVVDIGVNNGWVLMNIAEIVSKNDGYVYGFEPHPGTYNRCIKNIQSSKLSNCKVFNLGCGDKPGELNMISEKDTNSGENRIVSEVEVSDIKGLTKVRITTLDEHLKDIQEVNLIKIDVEGFELHVLKGAVNILEKFKPTLFIEIDEKLLAANQSSPNDIFQFLQGNFNYRFVNASNDKEVKSSDDFSKCHFDAICIP